MSVIITPSEQLEFQRPLTRSNKETVFVKNPNDSPVAFKVKTTAPKQYSVRPNAGRIEPNSEIEVLIILQPFKEEPSEDYKCKDKFLVQTAPISTDMNSMDVASLWNYIEKESKETMHQHRIKCVFLPSQDNIGVPPTSIPAPINTKSVALTTETNVGSSSPKLSTEEKTPVARQFPTRETSEKSSQQIPAKKNNIVEAELNTAQETIKNLKQQIKALSANKSEKQTSSEVTSKMKDIKEIGYPPQVVIGVAILVFILTYLFV